MKKTLTIVVAVMLAGVSFAQRIDTTEPAYFKATVNVYGGLYLPASGFYIGGTKVTATAANLNSGVAGSTASSVSNANLIVYGSNITTVANGAVALGGTLAVTGASTNIGVVSTRTNVFVGGNLYVAGTNMLTGATTVGSTLTVVGATAADSLTTTAGKGLDAASAGKLLLGTVTANAIDIGVVSTTLAAKGNVTVAGTLNVTGVTTLTAMPKLTTTNAPGSVVAKPIDNLPTGATTNALYFTITVGAVNYAVPMYALP